MSFFQKTAQPLQAVGLCLALTLGAMSGGPALAVEKAAKAKSLPLEQKVDQAAPPAVNTTPDSKLTPASALQDKPPSQAKAQQSLPPASVPESMTAVSTLQNDHIQPVSFSPKSGKPPKPLAYSPLEAIAIFPVVKHGSDKAFGDIPLVVAREFALKMEQKAPNTRVLHPIYTVDELRLRGLGHVYDKMMAYYIKTGRPEPLALDYLLGQLKADGRLISRVMFVEADMDMGHTAEPSGFVDRFKGYMTDATPKFMKYHVEGRVQVFNAEEPNCPMVWSFNRSKALKINEIVNVTPSVYQDSDSQHAFAKLSRELSRDVLLLMPKTAYMHPEYDLSVQGQVVSAPDATTAPITDNTRNAIERILGQP